MGLYFGLSKITNIRESKEFKGKEFDEEELEDIFESGRMANDRESYELYCDNVGDLVRLDEHDHSNSYQRPKNINEIIAKFKESGLLDFDKKRWIKMLEAMRNNKDYWFWAS